MRGRLGVVALVAGAGLLVSGCATVGRLTVDGAPSTATAVSDTGYIAGTTNQSTPAMFVRTPDGAYTYVAQSEPIVPTAVNDAGTVVGYRSFTNGFTRIPLAFRWTAGSGVITMDPNLNGSAVEDINTSGDMVGWTLDVATLTGTARRWTPDGTAAALPNPSGLRFAKATGIDDAGDIVGMVSDNAAQYRLVRWDGDDQAYHEIDPGPVHGSPAIGGDGTVVATAIGGDGLEHATLWTAPGYQRVALPGGDESRAEAVNDKGEVVGAVRIGSQWKAARWAAGSHVLTVLPGLSDADSSALGLDNHGVIVGSSKTADGVDHAVTFKAG